MTLLRHPRIWPGRRPVVQVPLEAEAERVEPQFHERLVDNRQLAAGHALVELTELHRIRTVEHRSPERRRHGSAPSRFGAVTVPRRHGSIGRRMRRTRLLSAY